MGAVTASRLIDGRGTSEHAWQRWLQRNPLKGVSSCDLVAGSGTVHIVAPHPDDEILACAGMIQQLGKSGTPITIWAVTDGEASHPETSGRSKENLAAVRTRESQRAVSLLNANIRRHRLRIRDGGVTDAEEELAATLESVFRSGDTVVAPWLLDGHPDHEAAARASWVASRKRLCRFLEVPIWGWHWARPDNRVFPVQRAVAIALTPAERRLKCSAIYAFESQLKPDQETGKPAVLPEYVLARFTRFYEVFFR